MVLYFQIIIDSHFEWEHEILVSPCFDRHLQRIGLKLILITKVYKKMKNNYHSKSIVLICVFYTFN